MPYLPRVFSFGKIPEVAASPLLLKAREYPDSQALFDIIKSLEAFRPSKDQIEDLLRVDSANADPRQFQQACRLAAKALQFNDATVWEAYVKTLPGITHHKFDHFVTFVDSVEEKLVFIQCCEIQYQNGKNKFLRKPFIDFLESQSLWKGTAFVKQAIGKLAQHQDASTPQSAFDETSYRNSIKSFKDFTSVLQNHDCNIIRAYLPTFISEMDHKTFAQLAEQTQWVAHDKGLLSVWYGALDIQLSRQEKIAPIVSWPTILGYQRIISSRYHKGPAERPTYKQTDCGTEAIGRVVQQLAAHGESLEKINISSLTRLATAFNGFDSHILVDCMRAYDKPLSTSHPNYPRPASHIISHLADLVVTDKLFVEAHLPVFLSAVLNKQYGLDAQHPLLNADQLYTAISEHGKRTEDE